MKEMDYKPKYKKTIDLGENAVEEQQNPA